MHRPLPARFAPFERPHASNTHHMPTPASILGARTRRAERIAKEAENASSSEKSSSTESSSTESSSDEVEDETNSKSSAKSSDINSSCADNSNTENVSDIEDQSVGNAKLNSFANLLGLNPFGSNGKLIQKLAPISNADIQPILVLCPTSYECMDNQCQPQ